MKDEIRKRIDTVSRGEVPEGFQQVDGYVFPADWHLEVFSKKFKRSLRRNTSACNNVLTISAQLGLVSQKEYYDKDIASEDKSGYFLLRRGEFTYNKSYSSGYPYGAIKRLEKYEEGIVSPLYICFEPKQETNTDFYSHYFEAGIYNREIYHFAQEGARNHGLLNIATEDFFAGNLIVPPEEEQKRIVEILSSCDRVIELKQKLVEELQQLKKTCLAKMFPRNGADVPELRFPGFTDPWEQRKLGEICQVTMGQSPDGSTYSETPSDYILVQGNADLKDGWVSPRIWTTQKTKTAEAGDLIMSVRAPAGAMGKTTYNVVLGRGVAGIRGNEFIYQSLVKMDSDGYWKKLAAGSTFESINSDAVNGAELVVPQDTVEQNRIGDFFASIDNLITLHQCELEAEKQKKKALMQLLLTGLVRVNEFETV